MAGVESDFLAERHDIYQRLKKGKRKEERGKRGKRWWEIPQLLTLSLSVLFSGGEGELVHPTPPSRSTLHRGTHTVHSRVL